jgi:hypothetical protein
MRVGQDLRTARHFGLAADIVRHGQPAAGKTPPDRGDDGFVDLQWQTEQIGGRIASDVVRGRAESARGDDKVGTVECLAQRLADGRSIRDADLAADGDTQRGEFTGQPGEVFVLDQTEEEFGSGVDDLGLHQARQRRLLQCLTRS